MPGFNENTVMVVIMIAENRIFVPDPRECDRVGVPIFRHPDYRHFDLDWRGVTH
jgi:hypothetical protein